MSRSLAAQQVEQEVPRRQRSRRDVVDVVQRGADPGEEAGAEPDEGRNGVERELPAVLADPDQQPLDELERIAARAPRCAEGRSGGTARSGRRPARPRWPAARCVSPMSTRRTNGTAARSASNVSALARKGMLFSSAACSVRRRNPAGDPMPPAGPEPLQASGSSRSPDGPAAGPRLGQPALELLARRDRRSRAAAGAAAARRHRRARPRRRPSRSWSALLPLAELLGKLVQLLLGHGPELPQLPLQHPAGLLPAARRVEQRQAGAEHRAPEEPLGGRVTPPLDVDDLPALLATYIRSSYSPASGSSSAATSAGLSAA